MIKSGIRFVGRVLRNPAYALSGIRSIQWMIGHAIARRCPGEDVRLPRKTPFKKLLIVLRSSDAVQHCSLASRGLEKYGLFDKHDVIMRCGGSFVEAVRVFRKRMPEVALRIVLIEDRLSVGAKELYRKAKPIEEIVSPPGNRETFLAQVEVASKADDETLVCILEDDYLLDPAIFCEAFELFNSSRIGGFTPHFHPGTIDAGGLVRMYFLNEKFYIQVASTTCTFFISAQDIRRHYSRLRCYYGSEIGSINELWRKRVCLMPCCRTLAEHMHRSDLSYVWKGC